MSFSQKSLIQKVKDHLESAGRGAKKSLGQNFLINEDKIDLIIRKVSRSSCEELVEIGPGLGALTDHLIELDRERLVLIEMDSDFSKFWLEKGRELIQEDALKMDWKSLNLKKAILVSNLPYQISARLVIERSLESCNVDEMVLMFQKEVAQRIISTPKQLKEHYGILGVVAPSFWEIQQVTDLGPKDYYPAPKVASRVLHFKRRSNVEIDDPVGFFEFVKLSFSQRRKTLKKVLLQRCTADSLESSFDKLNLDAKVRPENLTKEQFWELYRGIR